MIFVTIGTHDQNFARLIKRLDEIAPAVKDKIIIQIGHEKYIPKNCETFKWAPSLEDYYKKARLVISHGGSSAWEFVYKYKTPLIVVPRQYQFDEHINDHQVFFSKMLGEKTGVKVICDISELTPELLNAYKTIGKVDDSPLRRLQDYISNILNGEIKNSL